MTNHGDCCQGGTWGHACWFLHFYFPTLTVDGFSFAFSSWSIELKFAIEYVRLAKYIIHAGLNLEDIGVRSK